MNFKVSDLFDPSTKQWHTQVLHTTFMHSTMEDIQQINQRDTHIKDELIWKENKKGIFLVKMAYQVVVCQQQLEKGEHSSTQSELPNRLLIFASRNPYGFQLTQLLKSLIVE